MQFRQLSKLIADTRRDLIVAQLLLEPDEAEIQDGYGIGEGLGLILRVAISDTREPVIREGVVDAAPTVHPERVPSPPIEMRVVGTEVSLETNAAPPVK
jgi:hypothetical protein